MRTLPRKALGLAAVLALTTAAAPAPRPLFAAFYVPWEPPALASLKAHVGEMDVFAPVWASVVSAKGDVRWETDPEAHAVLAAAAKRPRVMPVVSNAHDDVWDVAAAEAVIASPAAGAALGKALIARAQAEGFAGYVLDFENLTPKGAAGYPAFLARLRARLKVQGRELWVTSILSTDDAMQAQLAGAADALVLMAYDQCWATSTPGPIADEAWLRANLQARFAKLKPGRVVVALASYGYDWPAGKKAQVVAVPAAQALAAAKGQAVADPPGANAHFAYRAADGRHEVWWLSAADFARQRALAGQAGARGVALWRMGLEDPGLWTAHAPPPAPTAGTGANCQPLPH
jgi:spore germination protein YaaH